MILQFLLERPQFASQKLEMKLLGMGKDMKIKHGVPPPQHTHTHTHTNYEGVFFIKKNFAWGRLFWANLWGECFTWELMIRSCKGEENFH